MYNVKHASQKNKPRIERKLWWQSLKIHCIHLSFVICYTQWCKKPFSASIFIFFYWIIVPMWHNNVISERRKCVQWYILPRTWHWSQHPRDAGLILTPTFLDLCPHILCNFCWRKDAICVILTFFQPQFLNWSTHPFSFLWRKWLIKGRQNFWYY